MLMRVQGQLAVIRREIAMRTSHTAGPYFYAAPHRWPPITWSRAGQLLNVIGIEAAKLIIRNFY